MGIRRVTLAEWARYSAGSTPCRYLLACGANPQATGISLDELKLPRLMKIRPSSTTHPALVIRREDVSIFEYRSRRDYPGNCYLRCKICCAPNCLFEGDFAEYYTRNFAEAALSKIQVAFDAGEKEIDIPKDGLREPFKEYYNGKIVNCWEVSHYKATKELSLFDDF